MTSSLETPMNDWNRLSSSSADAINVRGTSKNEKVQTQTKLVMHEQKQCCQRRYAAPSKGRYMATTSLHWLNDY